MTKTKALFREKVWWSHINRDVEQLISSYHACQVTNNKAPSVEPLTMTNIPKHPWEMVATDLKGPVGNGHILVVIDV